VLAATDAFSVEVARLRAALAAGDEVALLAILEAAVAARGAGQGGGR
jgi:hypothetical protein